MGKDALPYFKWYPADADTDEDFRAMTDAEIGFYLRTLNHTWRNSGISSDPGERARILKVSRPLHDKMWARVGKKFQPSPNDPSRLVNARQEQERSKAISKSESASASVRTRYEKHTNEPTNEPTNVEETKVIRSENEPLRAFARADSDSDSSVVFSVSSQKKTTEVSVTDRAWEEYIGLFLAGGKSLSDSDISDALRNWLSLGFEDRLAALNHARETIPATESQFVQFPANHLRKKPWTRRGPGRLIPEPRKQSRAEAGQAKAAAEFLAEGGGE